MGNLIEYQPKFYPVLNDKQKIIHFMPDTSQIATRGVQAGYFSMGSSLIDLESCSNLHLLEINTMGYLDLKNDPFPIFKQVLKTELNRVGQIGTFFVEVGFEEKNSHQTNDSYETIGIWIKKGHLYFDYCAESPLVAQSKEYRRAFMQELIHYAELPLTIIDELNGYRLKHTQSGCLQLSISEANGLNPSGFQCEMIDVDIEVLVNRLEKTIRQIASPKRFLYEWCAIPSSSHGKGALLEDSHTIYKMLLEDKLPARNHELYVRFSTDHRHEVNAMRDAYRSRNDYSSTEIGLLTQFDQVNYMITPDDPQIESAMQPVALKKELEIN